MEPQKQYTGVWIPKDIFDNPKLTPFQKFLLAEIHSLDPGNGCFASNEWLAKKLHSTAGNVANEITTLRKHGYIVDRKFDGRKRFISAVGFTTTTPRGLRQSSPTGEGSITPQVNIDNSLDTSNVLKYEGRAFGDPQINSVEKQAKNYGFIVSKKDRNIIARLIKKHSYHNVLLALEKAVEIRKLEFAPTIDSIQELEGKWRKLDNFDYQSPPDPRNFVEPEIPPDDTVFDLERAGRETPTN